MTTLSDHCNSHSRGRLTPIDIVAQAGLEGCAPLCGYWYHVPKVPRSSHRHLHRTPTPLSIEGSSRPNIKTPALYKFAAAYPCLPGNHLLVSTRHCPPPPKDTNNFHPRARKVLQDAPDVPPAQESQQRQNRGHVWESRPTGCLPGTQVQVPFLGPPQYSSDFVLRSSGGFHKVDGNYRVSSLRRAP